MYADSLKCIHCNDCDFQSQTHLLLECDKVISCCPDLYENIEVEHNDIYGDLHQQLAVVRLFTKVLETVETLNT